jgi:serine/threonine protein kinase
MHQLLAAISYLRLHGIVHRDLKPLNLLVDPASETLKLADFGLARTVTGANGGADTPGMVTLWYRAPEILLLGSSHTRYTSSVDVWSAGTIFAEMATGRALFAGDSDIGTLMKTFQLLGTPTEKSWPGYALLEHAQPCFPQFRRSPTLVEELRHIPHALDLLEVRTLHASVVLCERPLMIAAKLNARREGILVTPNEI